MLLIELDEIIGGWGFGVCGKIEVRNLGFGIFNFEMYIGYLSGNVNWS